MANKVADTLLWVLFPLYLGERAMMRHVGGLGVRLGILTSATIPSTWPDLNASCVGPSTSRIPQGDLEQGVDQTLA